MKNFLVVTFLLGSFSAFANHHEEMKDMKFEDKKPQISSRLETKIKQLQESKACVDASKDEAQLKVCTDKMRAEKSPMKDKWKKHKKDKKRK